MDHAKWFLKKFGETAAGAERFVRATTADRSYPTGYKFQKGLDKIRTQKPGITGRWHDNRHTFVTNLAESR